MRKGASWGFTMMGFIALLGLNVAFITFFNLWSIADNMAVNRMEEVAGYNPALLLPNSNLMWFSAHTSLFLLLVLDLCAVVLLIARIMFRKKAADLGALEETKADLH